MHVLYIFEHIEGSILAIVHGVIYLYNQSLRQAQKCEEFRSYKNKSFQPYIYRVTILSLVERHRDFILKISNVLSGEVRVRTYGAELVSSKL